MLAALERLRGPGHRLLVAGDGELRDLVRDRVEDLGLGDRVTLLGLRGDVPDLMRAADGYVMSSWFEGLPMVLLEAAASGLPIVATDVGGNRQLVRPGVTGFIVPSRQPQALADAMRDLMALSGEDRARMGSEARSHVEHTYALPAVADAWVALYEELLQRQAPAHARPRTSDLVA